MVMLTPISPVRSTNNSSTGIFSDPCFSLFPALLTSFSIKPAGSESELEATGAEDDEDDDDEDEDDEKERLLFC